MERTGFEQWKPREVARLLALVETERRYYQEIVATLPAALVVLAADRTIVSANRAFRRLIGKRIPVRNEDLRQKTIEQVLPSDQLIERIRSAHVHGDTEPFVLRTDELGAEQRVFRIAIVPIRSWEDEMEAETLLMVEDLAGDADRAPPAPTAAMDRSTLPAILWQADAATLAFLLVDGSLEEILGYPASHWLTSPQFISGRIHPGDRDDVMALYQSVAAAGGEASAEFRALNASGETVWCRESVRVSTSSAGRAVLAGVLSRIGERRQLEAQSLIAGRMDALRGLASRMAHDLNNPLMIVTGYAEEMLHAVPAQNPLRVDIEEILSATTRMTELAGRLFTFSRSSTKAPAKVPLDQTVHGLRDRLQARAGEGVEVGLRVNAPVAAFADREQLEEAILELASAALENTREVSRLNVICATGLIAEQIQPATLKPGAYARIEIQAAGVGLGTPAVGVFESFGGQGLARVYTNLRQWGGDVFFSSHADQGSVFVIYLPHAEPEQPPVEEEAAATPEPEPAPEATIAAETYRETILLVDDEPGIRGLVRKILRREHYRVLEAENAEEALEMASSHGESIDLLLTDMVLPGMSGRDLAESLLRTRPSLKVVYISGYTGDETVRAGQFPPGSAFLQKPFTLGALTGKVREALDR
jgi:two-component system, cell cycle sensor histidine kinase and response regulator CckA